MNSETQNNLGFFNFTTLWFGASISVAEILAGGLLAPLFAILLTDYFILKKKLIDTGILVYWGSLAVCALGTIIYYQLIELDFILGATIPVMVITGLLHIITRRLTRQWKSVKI